MSDIRLVLVRLLPVIATVALIVGSGLLSPSAVSAQQQYDVSLYSSLRWRMIGPFRGGRVNAVSGVPRPPTTFYFGSVGGGGWKTANFGRTWGAGFGSQPGASDGGDCVG